MNLDGQKRISSSNVIFVIFCLGISYWVIDPVINALFWGGRSISDSIINPTSREIWSRFFVIFIFIVLGAIVDRILYRQRRTSAALRESEEKFRQLYEDAPLAYQTLNDSGHIVKVNRAWLELLGYPEEEIIGRWFGDFICAHMAEEFQRAFLRIKHSYAVHGVELEMIRKDGSVIMVAIDGKTGNNEGGNLRQIHCILNDVTERHRAEEALRRSEAKFRDLAELLPETVFECDLAGKITFVNLSAVKTFQYSNAELTSGMNIFQLIIPKDRDKIEAGINRLVGGGDSIATEFTAIRKDGSHFQITVRGSLVTQNNKVVGIRGFAIDISDRVRAQREIEESLSLLRTTLESTADGILVADYEGKILTYNNRFMEMWGIPESIMTEKDDNKIIEFVLDLLKNPDTFVARIKELYAAPDLECNDILELKDGRVFSRYSRPQPLNDKGWGRVWSFRDLTSQLRADEAIRENEKLLQSVFTSIQDGLCVIDTDLDIIHINKAAEQLLDCKTSVAGKKCYQVLHGRNSVCQECLAIRAIKTKQPQTTEYSTITGSGETRYVEIFLYPRLDRDGISVGAIMFLRDITRQKLAQETISENETKFRTLFETANDGIHLMDGDTFIACNPKAAEIFGCDDISDMVNHSPMDFSPPTQPDGRDSTEKALEYINAALSGHPQRFYWQHCRKDRTLFDSEISLNCFEIKGKKYLQALERDITARRLAEEELQKQKQQLADIIEGTNVGTWEWNIQTGKRIYDERWANIVGYTLEELALLGANPWKELIHPEDAIISDNILERHTNKELDYYECECRLKHKNGEWIWIQDRGKVIAWTKDGKPLRITGTHTDITRRKLTEQRLKESEEKYRITFESTGTATVLVESDGTISLANLGFEQLSGYALNEVMGKKKWMEFVVAEDIDEMLRLFNIMMNENRAPVKNYEFQMITKAGDVRNIYLTIDLIPGEKRCVASLLDFTERKRAEEAFIASEEKFNQLAEQSRTFIWEVDTNGLYTYINNVAEAVIGYPADEVVGKMHFYDLHPQEGREEFKRKAFEIFARQERFKDLPNAILTKAGRQIWVSTNGLPILDRDGRLLGYRGSDSDITERKKTEIELRENEEKYRVTFESTGTATVLIEPNTVISLANMEFERLTGFSKEEIEGKKSWTEFVVKEDLDRMLEQHRIRRENREQALRNYEFRLITKSGEIRDIYITVDIIADKRRSVASLLDITERKQIENELRYQRQQLADVIEGTHVGTWEWNILTGHTCFNERWAEIVGYSLEGLAPLSIDTWLKLVHPEDNKKSEEMLKKHFAGELDYYDIECRMRHKNGEWIWVHDRGKVVEWSNGRPVRMTGTHTDITERKRAEEKLRASEQRFRELAEMLPETVYEMDIHGKITFANQAAFEQYGYTVDDYERGLNAFDMMIPNERQEAREGTERLLGGEIMDSDEWTALRKDGSTFPVIIKGVPIIKDGKPVGLRGIAFDISKTKKAEEDLRRAKDFLNGIINAISDPVFVKDEQLRLTAVNDAMCRHLGKEREEIIGNTMAAFFPEKYVKGFQKADNDVLYGDGYLEKEETVVDNRGVTRVNSTKKSLYYDPVTGEKSIVGIIRDTTERKKMEDALRENEEKFRTLFSSMSEGMALHELIYDEKGMPVDYLIVDANEAYQRHTGISREWAVGKKATEVYGCDQAPYLEEYSRVAETGEAISFETYFPPMKRFFRISIYSPGTKRFVTIFEDITEKRTIEEELKENKERYQALYNNAQVGLFRTRISDGKIMECNLSCALMFGYNSIEDCVNEYVTSDNYVDPGTREKMLELIRSNGEIKNFIARFRRKDGSTFWSNFTAKIHPDKGFIEGVVSDITDKVMAEQALRESEEKYRSIVENSSDIIMLTKPDGKIAYISPQCRQILGFEQHEILANTRAWYTYQDDLPKMKIHHARALQGIPGSNVEYRVRTKSGAIKNILHSWSPIFKDGQLQMIVSVVRDITDRIQALEALRESEIRFRTIFETAVDSIFIKNTRREYVSVNPATERLLGFSVSQLLGHSDEELFDEENGRHIREKDERVLAGETVEDEVTLMIRGEPRIFHVVKAPMKSAAGTVNGICGIIRDITDKRRMEEELIKTEKLESVGLLAGGIAHDFNNIMTAIMGNISLARTYCDETSEINQRLADAEKASSRAQDLTRQLLTFAKGGAPVKRAASIVELIQETAEFALRGSNVKCEFNMEVGLYPVEFDEGQISQAINNLVINAAQAMPNGGTLTMTAQNQEVTDTFPIPIRPGKAIKISIADQGIGIPEQNLTKIFDPFFTTKEAGNGLGLSTTYSIIKRHDGHIAVESTVGAGTTFHLYLPATDKIPEIQQEVNSDILKGNERILIMDDEEAIRIIASLALSELGYKVITAQDGSEAIRLYEDAYNSGNRFDAVIMDLTIPGGMGGKEAIEKLRAFDPAIKAIVSSGFSEDPVLSDFEKYGFCGYVPKPYNVQQLSQALRKVLAQSELSPKPVLQTTE
jgi:PAS domain S-box-containing protein